jgi:hypothetical protein
VLKIVCCFAPEDKKLMEGLRAHLRVLEIQHVSIRYVQHMLPGAEWEQDRQLQSAHLILFLVSSDFLNSYEHYKINVLSAMERYKKGEVQVIPIILRPVHWQDTPFGTLQSLPEWGKAVTDPDWKTLDHAFFEVVSGIKRVIADKGLSLLAQQESDAALSTCPEESMLADSDGVVLLEQIIQSFKTIRRQIANTVSLKMTQGLSVENCESQYNRLYGDTMVFLARYIPQTVSDDEEGFVEAVYRKAAAELRQRSNFSVWLARWAIVPLAELEKLAAQIDACVAILEFYKRKYFTSNPG